MSSKRKGGVRTTAIAVLMFCAPAICYPVERTEAQRYYELAVSLIKSDLYEDGLKTLNEVAFLYPDSDVADDALYELALIRERVGNGEINVGQAESLEAQRMVLKRLTGRNTLTDILILVNAHLAGERVFDTAIERAVTQYILALDYLNTLTTRYPDSDRLEDSKSAFERIRAKIDSLVVHKPTKTIRQVNRKRDFIMVGLLVGGTISVILSMVSLGTRL